MLTALALASAVTTAPPARAHVSVSAVDTRAVLPAGAPRRQRYVRYYALATIRGDEDLPFSTSPAFHLQRPREVWLALFIQRPGQALSDPPFVRVVARAWDFPQVVHGGCSAIALVADARTGATLGSWCYAAYTGRSEVDPTYLAKGNPLRVK
jgi:hypothetical protein